jgi:hypothetical protein
VTADTIYTLCHPVQIRLVSSSLKDTPYIHDCDDETIIDLNNVLTEISSTVYILTIIFQLKPTSSHTCPYGIHKFTLAECSPESYNDV